jgi:hypothetical protein
MGKKRVVMLWNIQRCRRSNRLGYFLVSLRQLFQVSWLEVVRGDWRETQTTIRRFELQKSGGLSSKQPCRFDSDRLPDVRLGRHHQFVIQQCLHWGPMLNIYRLIRLEHSIRVRCSVAAQRYKSNPQ